MVLHFAENLEKFQGVASTIAVKKYASTVLLPHYDFVTIKKFSVPHCIQEVHFNHILS